MNKLILSVLGLVALLGAITGTVALVGGNQSGPLGGSTSDSWSVGGALSVTGASTLTGDATISGGTVNVTTSNTATSTVVAGCYQFYATSTATSQKFLASTTPGIMYSQYGTCPNL
jgi:autotransporter-associated beta strand protein